MERFQPNEKVIIKIRGTVESHKPEMVDTFAIGIIEQDAPDAGYHVRVLDKETGEYSYIRYFTFYDVAPYNKWKLQDLSWESDTAQRAIRNMNEMWKWGRE